VTLPPLPEPQPIPGFYDIEGRKACRYTADQMQAYAAAAVAAEREANAKLCDAYAKERWGRSEQHSIAEECAADHLADAIRARGQVEELEPWLLNKTLRAAKDAAGRDPRFIQGPGGGSAHAGPGIPVLEAEGGTGGVNGAQRQCPTCGIEFFAGEGRVHCGKTPMVKVSDIGSATGGGAGLGHTPRISG